MKPEPMPLWRVAATGGAPAEKSLPIALARIVLHQTVSGASCAVLRILLVETLTTEGPSFLANWQNSVGLRTASSEAACGMGRPAAG